MRVSTCGDRLTTLLHSVELCCNVAIEFARTIYWCFDRLAVSTVFHVSLTMLCSFKRIMHVH